MMKQITKVPSIASNKRVFYFDILRTVACLAVVMIHASGKYVESDVGSLNFWVGNIFDSLSRFGVPVFVMISGALMLDEKYLFTSKKLLGHIKKMVLFFVFWSASYCLLFSVAYPMLINSKVQISRIILDFIQGYFHLWFVYMIIGMYLLVPILRQFVKIKNKKYVEYFLVLSFVFAFLIPQVAQIVECINPDFDLFNEVLKTLNLQFVGGYTFYFILGWYLHNFDVKNKNLIYILGFLSVVFTIVGTYFTAALFDKPTMVMDNNCVNVASYSAMVFVFFKNRFVHNRNRYSLFTSATNCISKYSLGVYAIHAGVITLLNIAFVKLNMNFAVFTIPVAFIVAFVISIITSIVLSKIPFLKKMV